MTETGSPLPSTSEQDPTSQQDLSLGSPLKRKHKEVAGPDTSKGHRQKSPKVETTTPPEQAKNQIPETRVKDKGPEQRVLKPRSYRGIVKRPQRDQIKTKDNQKPSAQGSPSRKTYQRHARKPAIPVQLRKEAKGTLTVSINLAIKAATDETLVKTSITAPQVEVTSPEQTTANTSSAKTPPKKQIEQRPPPNLNRSLEIYQETEQAERRSSDSKTRSASSYILTPTSTRSGEDYDPFSEYKTTETEQDAAYERSLLSNPHSTGLWLKRQFQSRKMTDEQESLRPEQPSGHDGHNSGDSGSQGDQQPPGRYRSTSHHGKRSRGRRGNSSRVRTPIQEIQPTYFLEQDAPGKKLVRRRFNKRNVSEFVKELEANTKFSKSKDEKKVKLLLENVKSNLYNEVKVITQNLDWEKAKQEIKTMYSRWDSDNPGNAISRLEDLLDDAPEWSTRSPLDDTIKFIVWLNEHKNYMRLAFPSTWSKTTTQNRSLIRKLPSGLTTSIKAWKEKGENIVALPYEELIDQYISAVKRSKALQEFRPGRSEGKKSKKKKSRRNTSVSTESSSSSSDSDSSSSDSSSAASLVKSRSKSKNTSRKGKDKVKFRVDPPPKEAKEPQTEDTKPAQMTTADVLNLAKAFEDLKIAVNQINPQYQPNLNMSRHQRRNSFQVSNMNFDQDLYEEPVDINNNQFNRQGRSSTCMWCRVQDDHQTHTCSGMLNDRELGVFYFSAGTVIIGNGQDSSVVPQQFLRSFFLIGSTYRRAAYFWATVMHPGCVVDLRIKRQSKNLAPSGRPDKERSWEPTAEETATLLKAKEAPYLKEAAFRPCMELNRMTDTNTIEYPYDPEDSDVERRCLASRHENEDASSKGPQVHNVANKRQRVRTGSDQSIEELGQPNIAEWATKIPPEAPPEIEIKKPTKRGTRRRQSNERKFPTKDECILDVADMIMDQKLTMTVAKLAALQPELVPTVQNQLRTIADGIIKSVYLSPVPRDTRSPVDNAATNTMIFSKRKQISRLDRLEDILREPDTNTVKIDDPELSNASDDETTTVGVHTMDGYTSIRSSDDDYIGSSRGRRTPAVHYPGEAMNFMESNRPLKLIQDLPMLAVRLQGPNGRMVKALIDSGSEGNMVSKTVAEEFGLPVWGKPIVTRAYTNDRATLPGETLCTVYMGNTFVQVRMFVAPEGVTQECLLGMPFIRATQLNFDHKTRNGDLHAKLRMGNIEIITPVCGGVRRADHEQNLFMTMQSKNPANVARRPDTNAMMVDRSGDLAETQITTTPLPIMEDPPTVTVYVNQNGEECTDLPMDTIWVDSTKREEVQICAIQYESPVSEEDSETSSEGETRYPLSTRSGRSSPSENDEDLLL